MSDDDIDDIELGDYWGESTAEDFRSLADAMERYGAASLDGVRESLARRGSILEPVDGGPVQAAVRNELAGLADPEGHRWMAPAALALARSLDDPGAEPYYASLTAEVVKYLVTLRGGPEYEPRLRLIDGGGGDPPPEER
jgi:hypothetical protein